MKRGKSLLVTTTVGVLLALLASSVGAGEIGVCPPYSKTFGPDDPREDIRAFIEEVDARPDGGTILLEPGQYWGSWGPPIFIDGLVCISSSSPQVMTVDSNAEFQLSGGATLTIRGVGVGSVAMSSGSLFFAQSARVALAVALKVAPGATAYVVNTRIHGVENRGTLFMAGGAIEYAFPGLLNSGYAYLDQVTISGCEDESDGSRYDPSGLGVLNEASGTAILTHVTVTSNGSCGKASCGGAGIENNGGDLSMGGSIVAANHGPDCTGSFRDLGYNVVGALGDCTVLDRQATTIEADPLLAEGEDYPTELSFGSPAIDMIPLELCHETDGRGLPRTDGDGDGIVACDAGALEFTGQGVVIKSPPFSRDYGLVDLETDTALYVVFMSSAAFDPADVVVASVILGDTGAVPRGYGYVDRNGDGILDLRLRYKLKDVPLACGEQVLTVSATTSDGKSVGGELKLEVTGCTF